jgi:hypothetical protein
MGPLEVAVETTSARGKVVTAVGERVVKIVSPDVVDHLLWLCGVAKAEPDIPELWSG